MDEAHITTFAVLPEHRRKRIGERMLQRLFEVAEVMGGQWLTLEVRVSNLPAQRLYEKYGFRRAGVRRRYYSDNNEDALIMWTEKIRDRAVQDRLAELRKALGE
ncbi:MAG: ribosomal protein S18-alanine N-acetyltransferase [Chloroflexi bacterium]|nr:ribosomal protein S18-alanine N-acetyltransferase [Chloroflexota bacterium]